MSALYHQLATAPIVYLPTPPAVFESPPFDELSVSILQQPALFGFSDSETRKIRDAVSLIANVRASRHLNPQKTQWLYNQLTKF